MRWGLRDYTFNSLFEMPRRDAGKTTVRRRHKAFNSLFEMLSMAWSLRAPKHLIDFQFSI